MSEPLESVLFRDSIDSQWQVKPEEIQVIIAYGDKRNLYA